MSEQKTKLESYFDLAEHSTTQKLLFMAIFFAGVVVVFIGAFLPLMEFLFRVYQMYLLLFLLQIPFYL